MYGNARRTRVAQDLVPKLLRKNDADSFDTALSLSKALGVQAAPLLPRLRELQGTLTPSCEKSLRYALSSIEDEIEDERQRDEIEAQSDDWDDD